MPIGGTRETNTMGNSYRRHPMYEYAKAFTETAKSILQENGFDIFEEPGKVMRVSSSREAMKRFFCEDSIDTDNSTLDAIDLEDHEQCMKEQFENDIHAMNEHTALADLNPIIGMAIPVHKLILMNNVFDKGGIQKVTAVSPRFTIGLERRMLITPEGDEIDMYLEQNRMTAAIDATVPTLIDEVDLPITEEDYDPIAKLGGTHMDNLSIETRIYAVKLSCYYEEGDVLPDEKTGYVPKRGGKIATAEDAGEKDTWFKVDVRFQAGYGGPNHYDRTCYRPLQINRKTMGEDGTVTIEAVKFALAGSMNKNRISVMDAKGKISAVRMYLKLDSSNAMFDTCRTDWRRDDILVEIPEATPISTTITPESVKDIAALYNVNQLTKVMGMFKTVMSDYKDNKIKQALDESYEGLDERNSFMDEFDFAPYEQYALDPVEWRRKMFIDLLDAYVTEMLYVLNDNNMTVTIFGDPEIVRKITPVEHTYTAPSNIGPVELDYTQTICNVSNKRVYNFIGSDKMRHTNELMVILNPRNSERIMYRIYDYQLYVSNEIRSISNPALPNIHAFERWKFVEYMPVQGRIKILNPSGLKK